jgi:glycerol dehydrogenase-like iron-containing ADH family enzyme
MKAQPMFPTNPSSDGILPSILPVIQKKNIDVIACSALTNYIFVEPAEVSS